jgi:methylenetetrahydrofolate dehydrogenase (NADP+)/methenyltetrahydrofolate cyclohydrolase
MILNGSELAGYIKERQARTVRGLRQAAHVVPKLAIVQTIDSPVIDTYVGLKKKYGADILVEVEAHKVGQSEAAELIKKLNDDPSVHGIIVQLPLENPAQTDQLVNLVEPAKDVDGLGERAQFDPATPMAINWLLGAYNIELKNKKIVIVGEGRLVGRPLAAMWQRSELDVEVVDIDTEDKPSIIKDADVVVTATGDPGSLTSDMLKIEAVVVDAGTASEGGKIVGDVSEEVRESRSDLTITPVKGGVGPLTVCALFDNVLLAARRVADQATPDQVPA